MTSSLRAWAAALALAFLALHLPFPPASFEDLDSLNFALGIVDFDVAEHQPHPPGYPLFMAAAKAADVIVRSELHALALLSILAGTLAVFAVAAFARGVDRERRVGFALAVTGLTVTAPLFWVTAARPLSDMSGLAAAVACQALILAARTERGLALAAFAAAFAVGFRSQVVWLTLPLLVLVLARGAWPSRGRAFGLATLAYGAGALAWFVPLLAAAGGPGRYLEALAGQGAEDFSGVVMLWTTPTLRQLVTALIETFVVPWAVWPLAALALLLSAGGMIRLGRGDRTALVMLAAAYGPYLAFHLLFQETVTTRYALPLMVPIGYLMASAVWPAPAAAIEARRANVAVAVVAAIASVNLAISLPALLDYAAAPAPAFRLLADMRLARGTGTSGPAPVLAMHRREAFDFRRPLRWERGSLEFGRQLPSPPKHEWLELVAYWNGGGRTPVWFIADPLRSDLALVDHGPAREYRWSKRLAGLVGGARPNEMDWHVLARPDWYLGEGWSLTPEAAGVAREDGKTPAVSPIRAWLRRRDEEVTLMLGGRNFAPGRAAVRVTLDDRLLEQFPVDPGFFLRMLTIPAGGLSGGGDYAVLTVAALAGEEPVNVAIEQFDAAPINEPVVGFGEGWHEGEYDPRTGVSWRWTSERSVLQVGAPVQQPLLLRLRGETDPSADSQRLTVHAGDRLIVDQAIAGTFELEAKIPADAVATPRATLVIGTSQTHVPAETSWRPSGDRRRLGVKIFDCRLSPAF